MYKLLTSNEDKLREFRRLGLTDLDIQKGIDLPEVDADPVTVIVYKSLTAGKNTIVEDTSLHVDGTDVGIHVRWLMDNLHTFSGRSANWMVLLGVNDGESIHVYCGEVPGILTNRFQEPVGFGFDCRFIPTGQPLTLYELDQKGSKDAFSARKAAITNLQQSTPIASYPISAIQPWKGNYQKIN